MKRLPWRDTGVWLAGDAHAHYRLVGFEELVKRSQEHCDFQAITSHPHEVAAFKAQPALIEEARTRYPDLILINGVQWNPPVGNFVTVWAPGVARGMPLLKEFLERFDVQVGGADKTEENFLAGLRFLSERPIGDALPAAFIQHPHPSRQFTPEQIRSGLDVGAALAGICVSSGKREQTPGGGVIHPWAGEVGGFADTLFAEGCRVVLTGDSDLHQPGVQGVERDWPGLYRRTYLYCPERSEAGVFAGLRGGAWYLVVGGLVRGLNVTARVGDDRATLGEELAANENDSVDVTVEFAETGNLDSLELIGNPGGGTRILAQASGADLLREGATVHWAVQVGAPPGTFFLRVRGTGTATEPSGDPACFYSAPLWVSAE
ncbi:MAG: hypothetical protein KAX80_00550 [Planctomycetes bacterium]|nr:hypothetical protein [Planctomycetota bacterium]